MTGPLSRHPVRVVASGLLLWIVGMVVGSVVFAVPRLKAAPPIPYLTANPCVTVPIVVLWVPLAWLLVRRSISRSSDPAGEGLRTGLLLVAVNMLLDLVFVAGVMHAGPRFYAYAGLWLAYAALIVVPWVAGLQVAKKRRIGDARKPS